MHYPALERFIGDTAPLRATGQGDTFSVGMFFCEEIVYHKGIQFVESFWLLSAFALTYLTGRLHL